MRPMPKKTRTERDSIGPYQVPADALYGIFTARALDNFQLSGQNAPRVYIQAIGILKAACAAANVEVGFLDKKLGGAIEKAAGELAEGKFDEEYRIDMIQAGAGTPFNMNANEIIANRANEILGGKRGEYSPIHPNNHVNMSQSSNDVTPSAIRLAALFLYEPLLREIEALEKSFSKIAAKHKNLLKVGRTHLEDAVPITVGQEFGAFATQLAKARERFVRERGELLELGIGGTALGTGINTHPQFQKKVVARLARITKLPLRPTRDLRETTASMNNFVAVSNCCRMLAIDLTKIANDLKLLNMGPLAGLAEITLPEVEPGSSIMPGKVNPSVAEAVHIAAYDVMASDHAIALAAQAGQLQLNVMTPLILKHLLSALQLLTNTCKMFREHCADGIVVNTARIKELYEGSLVTATALNPYIGYEVTAELVKEALKKKRSILEVVREKDILAEKDLREVLSPKRTSRPAAVDRKIKAKKA